MALDRQEIVDLLRHLGYAQAADEAAQTLPDSVSADQAREFADRYNISRDELISRMGGSP
jgi:hypothetical protein